MEPTAPSILALTQSCISKFKQLLAAQRPEYIGSLESRLADFSLWADGLGALAKPGASLDSRLQGRTNDLQLVKNVLIMLADSLDYSNSLAESDANSAASIQNIDSAIEILALISVAIRRTGKASRNRRADQTFDPSKHQELRKHLECILLLRPTEEALFQETDDGNFIAKLDTSKLSDLQQRIIQANLRRRHNFLMAQKHSIAQMAPKTQPSAAQPSLPIGSLLQTKSILNTQKLASPQNPAPFPTSNLAIRGQSIAAPTISGYSLASTAEGSLKFNAATKKYTSGTAKTQITFIASNADFPKAPFIDSNQKISKCPCCCQSIPGEILQNPKEWKQHIIEDICPYTCIAENCPTPYLLFCTRNEWETHVKESHLPYWQCLFCKEHKDYLTMESILSHLQEDHQKELLETSLPTLLSWSTVQRMGIKSCPLCSSCGAEDSPELVDHVLQHTYEFALRSLPWPKPIIHNLNVQPGSFNLSLNSSHEEEIQRLNAEEIQRLNAEDDKRLTVENIQRLLQVVNIRQSTAEGIQQWINKEIHDRKEPPELQLTDYDRANHAASEDSELSEYSNYFLTNQYFDDESDDGKSLKPQHDRSNGNSIAGPPDADRSMWNEAVLLEMQVIAAAGNKMDGKERLEILLKGQEGQLAVTKDIVKAAASNRACGKQVMRLLIIQPVKHVTIEKEAVASVAESFDGEMMALLLDQRGDQITVTEDVIKAAARNENGEEVMTLLLDRKADQITITEEVVKAAAKNWENGKEVMTLLLDRKGDQITITEEVFEAAVENWNGMELVTLLLDRRGDQITITEEVVKAAATLPENTDEVIGLLLEHQAKMKSTHSGDVVSPSTPPTSHGLSSLKLDAVAPHHKKRGDDWHVIFNPQVQRVLDVDPVHTLLHDNFVYHVQFSQDGRYVATGSNRFARIFDVGTGEEIHTLDCSTTDITENNYVCSVGFSPNGKYLATANADNAVRVWDITTETLHNHFKGHTKDVNTCDFARDGRTILSGSRDRTVRLWDIETGANTCTLTANGVIAAVAMSPDAYFVAAGSLDNTIYVWDVKTGILVDHLKGPEGHRDSVYSIAFLPNGKNLVSASRDGTIKMWKFIYPFDISSCVTTFQGHNGAVASVAPSPDALWIMSGSYDKSAQFWDSRTGAAQFILQGHTGRVTSVAPSPQGSYFATAGDDQKARIWAYRPYQAI